MSKISPNLSREITISNHVTPWLLTFRHPHQRNKFEEFKVSQSNVYAYLIILIVVSGFIVINKWYSWVYFPSPLSATALVTGLITPCLHGLVLLILRIMTNRETISLISKSAMKNLIIHLESFWILGCGVAYSLSIIINVQNGQCANDNFALSQGCNSEVDQMPLGMSMISLVLPVMLAMILKGARYEFVLFTFLLNVGVLVFCSYRYHLTASLPSILSFAPFCMVMMYENQRQNIAVFLLTQSQQDLLEENERLAEEAHANELRHMIGNVAHDLKTVCICFIISVVFVL